LHATNKSPQRNCIHLSSLSGCQRSRTKVHRPVLTCAQQTPTLQTALPCWYVQRTAGTLSGLARLARSPPVNHIKPTSPRNDTSPRVPPHPEHHLVKPVPCWHSSACLCTLTASVQQAATGWAQRQHPTLYIRCSLPEAGRAHLCNTDTHLPLLQPYAAGSHAMQFS
jgi:hypothetical protein